MSQQAIDSDEATDGMERLDERRGDVDQHGKWPTAKEVNEAVEGPKSTSDAQTEGKKEEEEMREDKEQEQEQ